MVHDVATPDCFGSGIAPKGLNKEGVLVPKGRIEAGAAYAETVHEVLHGSPVVALVPEYTDRFRKHFLFIKVFCSCHDGVCFERSKAIQFTAHPRLRSWSRR